jgi:large subunit ribosomal protein L3
MLGLIGKKIGMTQVFDEKGVVSPVTIIQIEDNVVVSKRTPEKNGYSACVIGSRDKKKSRITKPYAGQFKEGIAPKQYLVEFRDFEKESNVGDVLGVELFNDFDFVDVIGTSKGKGFQGVVKRHGFDGGRKTHGSKFHREPGSTGNSSTPGKTHRGIKMPGHMGNERVTVQNLKIVKVDAEKKVLLVRGAVPGPRDGMVIVRRAVKK